MQKLTEETVAGKNDEIVSSIKRVYICSPLSPQGRTPEEKEADLKQNINIAKQACRFAVKSGCMPYASHLYFTQFLSDFDAAERDLGISLGLAWLMDCDEIWIIGNRISEGMQREITKAKELNIPIKHITVKDITANDLKHLKHLKHLNLNQIKST